MKKSDLGDKITIIIVLAVLIIGLLYTLNGFFNKEGVSGSGRYYETYEDY